jgi:hypothetical protein
MMFPWQPKCAPTSTVLEQLIGNSPLTQNNGRITASGVHCSFSNQNQRDNTPLFVEKIPKGLETKNFCAGRSKR